VYALISHRSLEYILAELLVPAFQSDAYTTASGVREQLIRFITTKVGVLRFNTVFKSSSVHHIDKKSLFRRHGHLPAGTGLKERFHGGKGSNPSRRSQLQARTRFERNQAEDETVS